MVNLKDPKLYINREISWLKFNTRVLEEAQDISNPLLERLKFIAIYGTNLDEFYMIRVAGLKKLFKYHVRVTGPDKMTPLEQLKAIREYLHKEKKELEATFFNIVKKLEKEGLFIKEYGDLDAKRKKEIDNYFYTNLYPVIVPIAVDATHPFPHLNNLSFALVIKLADTQNENEIKYALIRIPRVLPRFVQIENTYIPIESIVQAHIESLFPGYKLLASAPFRVTRNADIEIEEEEADDFMELLEEGLKLRRKGEIVRLEIGADAEEDLILFLDQHLHIFKEDIYHYHIPLNLGALWQIVGNKNFPHLLFEPYTPKILPPFDSNESIFSIIEHEQDAMLFHPYESFDPVVRFISEASKDPNVLAIRMTLYRVGKNSPIVKALIDAAESGKQVTAMVELKARFDEENNLIWARVLENAGAHVIYGIPGFKVHAKIAQVIRKDGNRLKQYVHLATGNYNPATAKIYTDVSYFTTQQRVTDDATRFFHFLTGFSKRGKLKTLYMAPTQIKPKLLQLIEEERKKAKEGKIVAKMNSLVDPDVIEALYKASMAGVNIELIVRGICCLRPGVEGISENIKVISIVGKYLEHARIFYFKHADPQIFISSADWMPRNLERRIELMVPMFDEEIKERLFEILQIQLKDNVKARVLLPDGTYKKVPKDKKPPINSQEIMEEFAKILYNKNKKMDTTKAKKLASRLLKES